MQILLMKIYYINEIKILCFFGQTQLNTVGELNNDFLLAEE